MDVINLEQSIIANNIRLDITGGQTRHNYNGSD